MRTSSYLKNCIECNQPTAHPDDRAILRCEKCAEKFEPLPNIKRVKKAVKEAKF